MPADLKPQIQSALANLQTGDFSKQATQLFQTLGYRSDKTAPLPAKTAAQLLETYDLDGHFRRDDARINDWQSADILFQITDAEVKDALSGQNTLFQSSADAYNGKIIQSYLFLAVELKEESWNRGDLAKIVREINKLFPMPALVLFKHGGLASLGVINRRLNKTNAERDVLERVTLVKDIRLETPHRAHLEILNDLALLNLRSVFPISNFVELDAAWRKKLDSQTLNAAFYRDYKLVFEATEKQAVFSWGRDTTDELKDRRRDWTQRFFNRLIFLRFLEKKGWLEFGGSSDYLRALWQAPRAKNQTFLGDRLYWTFFYGLNTLGENRDTHSQDELIERRGQVPFLNGGLFDLQDELDVQNAVKFTDENAVFTSILELFERYYFTVAENTPLEEEVGVDPEMLGKVFEELTNERTNSGSYYTPRVVVSFMAREALKGYLQKCDARRAIETFVENGDASGIKRPEKVLEALQEVRVCDPACGSGAYLLGMMQELLRLRESLFAAHQVDPLEQYDRKLEIIERNLYGADLTEFAVNIAMLRLWLSLVVDYNGAVKDLPALPNLQYKIGLGDSLTAPDPTDKGKVYHAAYLPLAAELSLLHREWFEESYRRSKGETTRAKAEIKADIDAKMEQIRGVIGRAPAESHDWRLRFAEVFAHEGFDIVLANPPYGASVADATRALFFAGNGQSKDTYGLFMARGLQLLKPGGWFTFIVSDTWRTIKSHRPLRRRLLEAARVSHVIDLPAWIFGATVNTGILSFQKGAPDENHSLIAADVRALEAGAWEKLGAGLRAVAGEADDVQTLEIARYSYPQSLIETYDNASFFIADPSLYALMSDPNFQKLGDVADVKQGLATADNEYYLRKRQGARGSYAILEEDKLLGEAEIKKLSAEEKSSGVDPKQYGGRCFVPYDKGGASDAEGGWMPNYHVPTEYFIDWSKKSVTRLKTATIADVKRRKEQLDKIKKSDENSVASRFQNQPFYFVKGVSFSRTGIYAPTYRMGAASAFDTEGSAVFSTHFTPEMLLGILCSTFARFTMKNMVGHTVHTQVDELKEIVLPTPENIRQTNLETLVAAIIAKQKVEPRYAYWLDEGPQIDALVYKLYGLSSAQIREVEVWYCRRYERLARAQGVWERVQTEYGI